MITPSKWTHNLKICWTSYGRHIYGHFRFRPLQYLLKFLMMQQCINRGRYRAAATSKMEAVNYSHKALHRGKMQQL